MLSEAKSLENSPSRSIPEITTSPSGPWDESRFLGTGYLTLPLQEWTITAFDKFLRQALIGVCSTSNIDSLSRHAEQLMQAILSLAKKRGETGELSIMLGSIQGQIQLSLTNHGLPLFPEDLPYGLVGTNEKSPFVYQNHGRKGQIFQTYLDTIKSQSGILPKIPVIVDDSTIHLRLLKDGEERNLSKLFYKVYGYNYVHDFVYDEKLIAKKRADGELISHIAALDDGTIVAHVGLVKINSNPNVYEFALGLTDPNIISKGLFRRVFHQAFEAAKSLPMDYSLFEFVTNHDYSQKIVMRYDTHPLALNVGSQISEYQAKLEKIGIGQDCDDMDRYSILIGIKSHIATPFGKQVQLPVPIGERAAFLLEPFGLSWAPLPRFSPLPEIGICHKSLNESQKSVAFDLEIPGIAAIKQTIKEWHHLLRDDYQYASVDIPLGFPGLGLGYDMLTAKGFFLAGFVPYRFGRTLAIRVQALAPKNVGLDQIKIASEDGQRLLRPVRDSYERNMIL